MTLVGKQNISHDPVDDVNNDGVPTQADLEPGTNPGYYIDDIVQGGVGNCEMMAGMAALCRENWQLIQSRFTPAGDGYDVTLWNGSSWNPYHVPLDMTRGFNSAKLSGDFDNEGKAEIWPNLLEQAYAKMVGNGNAGAGYGEFGQSVYAGSFYTALTGTIYNPPMRTKGPPQMTNQEIWDAIHNALNNGKQVVISTFPNAPDLIPHHAYVVTGTAPNPNPDRLLLYNPHGSNSFILFENLAANIASYQILTNIP